MIPFPTSSGPEVTYSIDDDIPVLRYTNLNPPTNAATPKVVSKTYEQHTYIDWNHETLAIPHHSSSYISRKWLSIGISAILVGYATAAIQLISVTLNDFKKGLCLSDSDKWSLLNPYSTCPSNDWYEWSRFFFDSKNELVNWLFNFPIYLGIAILWSAIALHITINRDHLIKQSGIPEIKLIISGLNFNVNQYLGLKTLFYKVTGLMLVVSSGLWLGKEGPLVHVSCCIFNVVYSLLMQRSGRVNEAVRREILSAATATGISVAFDSPIGGVLFVLENGRNFLEQDLFQVSFGNFSWLFLEIVPFIVLGVLGGIYGFLLIKFNTYYTDVKFRRTIRNRICELFQVQQKWGKYLEIVAVIVVTTLLNFPFSISKLPLRAYLKLLFKDCAKESASDLNSDDFLCSGAHLVTLFKLLFILIQGFFLTAYSYGLDIPGGILLPSLVLGATAGRSLGIISQSLQAAVNWDSLATCTEKSCLVSPSSYAVVGAAAFMTGITKLTMCVVVIIFEMTGAVTYVLPIMCAVMISKFVSDWLCPVNIYDNWLQNSFNQGDNVEYSKGFSNEGKGSGLVSFSTLSTTIKTKLPDIAVKDLMIPLKSTKCLCLIPKEENNTINSLYSLINNDNHEGYPLIVNYESPIYIGYVSKIEVMKRISQLDDDPNSVVSFQVENLPNSILSMQLHYERNFVNAGLIQLELCVEKPIIIANESAPAVLISEEFEKLFLNYLVITEKDNHGEHLMCGFIDRFILASLISDEFKELRGSQFDYISGYEQGNNDSNEHLSLSNLRMNRKSIELIT
ncbi:GEF2 [[Candida] subhashii]|uniref:GEF2 n=1 Tax=[Candida] subhashii TaxID=561895 RepID=A0A8J5QI57_9ASCO|nr:GEF2 [[Candida] subhashii]KAG7666074.1 GEF2 [[Candida] subhashii]